MSSKWKFSSVINIETPRNAAYSVGYRRFDKNILKSVTAKFLGCFLRSKWLCDLAELHNL